MSSKFTENRSASVQHSVQHSPQVFGASLVIVAMGVSPFWYLNSDEQHISEQPPKQQGPVMEAYGSAESTSAYTSSWGVMVFDWRILEMALS